MIQLYAATASCVCVCARPTCQLRAGFLNKISISIVIIIIVVIIIIIMIIMIIIVRPLVAGCTGAAVAVINARHKLTA